MTDETVERVECEGQLTLEGLLGCHPMPPRKVVLDGDVEEWLERERAEAEAEGR